MPEEPNPSPAEKDGRRAALARLPSALVYGLRLAWQASRLRVLLTLAAQALAAVSLLAQILLVEQILSSVLAGGDDGQAIDRAVLPIILLAVLTAVTAAASTLGNLQHRLLGEHVNRQVWRRIL